MIKVAKLLYVYVLTGLKILNHIMIQLAPFQVVRKETNYKFPQLNSLKTKNIYYCLSFDTNYLIQTVDHQVLQNF